ncbi:thioredoxin family protein [Tenacibaculum todarodis]|uniref:Thioredoxin family protein n=1 Tax=Tenacibaculum todarodis TaxID=1850252 RepID=A0A1L3JHG8_9FLAO|nr:thioredoxin family protein [Tenacibaculum todarodis]APG64552.1 thioredoxin family protein [Tenacibaculum todarodis]
MKIKVLVLFMSIFLTTIFEVKAQESTAVLLEKAQLKAKKEGKSIFIKFEASWCGWCHKMTKDMKAESTKKFFENNYVTVPVVVNESQKNKNLENPGSTELLKKYKGDKAGLPFWLILNSDLEVITDSFDSNGQNLGGPGSLKEVNEFIKKLKKASTNFTKKDEVSIIEQFVMK